jgi:hypothetical protein
MQQQNQVVLTPVTPREGVDQLSWRFSWRKARCSPSLQGGLIPLLITLWISAFGIQLLKDE